MASLRAHFRDLAAGVTTAPDVKLMVLGDSRAGKSQICRRLRGEGFDETIASTHGIIVTSVPLLMGEGARLRFWDFGGQDIYHGTHALFVRIKAC